jgi:hypothetical protein
LRLVVLMASESTCREDAVNPVTHTLGLFQILTTGSANPRHLAPDELLAPETNSDLGASHLVRLLRLCGSFGAAVSVYHGHSRCRDWREDRHARRVVGMLEALRRWLQRRADALPGNPGSESWRCADATASGSRDVMGRVLSCFLNQLVADCPPNLSPCESCRVTECLQVDWERCEKRLAEIESEVSNA